MATTTRLAALTEISSTSEDPSEGLRQMLDALVLATRAEQLWIVEVDHPGRASPLFAHPDPDALGWDDGIDLRGALDDSWVSTHERGGAVSAGQLGGNAVALVVRRRWEIATTSQHKLIVLSWAATPIRLLLERTSLIERLRMLSTIDELTGLPNRRELMDRLVGATAAARRTRRPMCVAMLDLDHFKDYNDIHGHLAGDEVLRQLGTLLSQRCAPPTSPLATAARSSSSCSPTPMPTELTVC